MYNTPMFLGMMAMALILVHANTQPNKIVKRETVQSMLPASKPIPAFYAYRTTGLELPRHEAKKTIDYAGTHLNTGNALNTDTGVFTAPIEGHYYFFFSCVKHWDFDTLTIRLMKNSEEISTKHLRTRDWGTTGPTANHLSLDVQAMLYLNVNDTVNVDLVNTSNGVVSGGVITDYPVPEPNTIEFHHVTSFTGFLIKTM